MSSHVLTWNVQGKVQTVYHGCGPCLADCGAAEHCVLPGGAAGVCGVCSSAHQGAPSAAAVPGASSHVGLRAHAHPRHAPAGGSHCPTHPRHGHHGKHVSLLRRSCLNGRHILASSHICCLHSMPAGALASIVAITFTVFMSHGGLSRADGVKSAYCLCY